MSPILRPALITRNASMVTPTRMMAAAERAARGCDSSPAACDGHTADVGMSKGHSFTNDTSHGHTSVGGTGQGPASTGGTSHPYISVGPVSDSGDRNTAGPWPGGHADDGRRSMAAAVSWKPPALGSKPLGLAALRTSGPAHSGSVLIPAQSGSVPTLEMAGPGESLPGSPTIADMVRDEQARTGWGGLQQDKRKPDGAGSEGIRTGWYGLGEAGGSSIDTKYP